MTTSEAVAVQTVGEDQYNMTGHAGAGLAKSQNEKAAAVFLANQAASRTRTEREAAYIRGEVDSLRDEPAPAVTAPAPAPILGADEINARRFIPRPSASEVKRMCLTMPRIRELAPIALGLSPAAIGNMRQQIGVAETLNDHNVRVKREAEHKKIMEEQGTKAGDTYARERMHAFIPPIGSDQTRALAWVDATVARIIALACEHSDQFDPTLSAGLERTYKERLAWHARNAQPEIRNTGMRVTVMPANTRPPAVADRAVLVTDPGKFFSWCLSVGITTVPPADQVFV